MVRVGIPLPSLTQPLFCACPKSRSGFQTLYAVIRSGSFVCDCLCASCRDDNKRCIFIVKMYKDKEFNKNVKNIFFYQCVT